MKIDAYFSVRRTKSRIVKAFLNSQSLSHGTSSFPVST